MKICNKEELGKCGEKIALEFFQKSNFKILDKNFYCRQGEIDLIVEGDSYIVFVEVKTRSNIYFGNPSEAVNKYKQKHMYNAAKYYLYKNRIENCFVRFDVIEVLIEDGRFKVNHIKQVI